jgi:hypothetical protein
MGLVCLLMAFALNAQETVTVRVLPHLLATNREPFLIGLQMGFPDGPANPLRAECLEGRALVAETNIAVEAIRDLNTGKLVYRVTNTGTQAGGVSVESASLRKGAGYTMRLRCRHMKGPSSVCFRFIWLGGDEHGATEKTIAVKGGQRVEKAFAVTPHREGAYRCGFLVEAGSTMEFSEFSLVPDDAVDGWERSAVEALQVLGPGVVRWPVASGLTNYNWYHGVGPLDVRDPPVPASHPSSALAFGTAEFVRFCRLIHAEPLIRVTVPPLGAAKTDEEKREAAVQLAADWVAYCNAPSNQPLARLRARHGHAAPLCVKRWELAAAEGAGAGEGVLAKDRHDYLAAMKAADGSVEVAVARAGSSLVEVRDGYVAEVMRRLQAGDAAERAYYADWYGLLSTLNDALSRLRGGGGPVYSPYTPEQMLYRSPYGRTQLTPRGQVTALFNGFPARAPLVSEGVPATSQSPFQVVAAWTGADPSLVVYVYNSSAETRQVRVDLTALKRRFIFWAAEQLAADLTARRTAHTVPLIRKQRAGSALSQKVLCECRPASFTRIVVKE